MEEFVSATAMLELMFSPTVTLSTLELDFWLVKSESCEQEPITTIAAKAAMLKINFFIS
jgi:hypothetical protein